METLKSLCLASSVMVGGKEELFLKDEHYDMSLSEGIRIKITSKRLKDTTYTTLMNTRWFKVKDGDKPSKTAKP